MTFKEQIGLDINNVFINTNEFAEVLIWNGETISAVLDNDQLNNKKLDNDMLVEGDYLVFVAVSEFETAPNVGDAVKFKDKKLTIIDVKEDDGMYELVLMESRR